MIRRLFGVELEKVGDDFGFGRFFSPKCDRSPEADTEDVNVRFPLDDVAEWKSLHVSVRPREIFGGLGAPLEVKIVGIVPMKSSRSG